MVDQKNARMTPPSSLVLGLGCERGTDPSELIALAGQALRACGHSASDIVCVASLDVRAEEPAMLAVARHFGVPLRVFSAPQLEALTPRLANPSALVFVHTGCHGVAEAAALAVGGEAASLLVPKLKSSHATVAIAEFFQFVEADHSQVESAASQSETALSLHARAASISASLPSQAIVFQEGAR